MNHAHHSKRSVDHPRRIFLFFVVCFLIGDVLGILDDERVGISLVFILLITALSWKGWRYFCIFGCIALVFGYGLGNFTEKKKKEEYKDIVTLTENFNKKANITGTIDTLLYRKERTRVYRFNIDNFDNFDKNNENALYKGKTLGEQSEKYTIIVEIPANLSVHVGDTLSFVGTIKKNFDFPLTGYEKYSYFQGGYGYMFLPTFTRINIAEPGFFERIRSRAEYIFEKSFPRDEAGTILGMTIGSTRYISPELKEAFLGSGTSHILVVSGSNIAFVIVFVMFFLKYTPLRKNGKILLISIAVLFYVSLVGWEVSVMRASIMGVISFIIVSGGHRASSRALIGATALGITILEPLSPLYDVGYGLSFGATLGILLFQKSTEAYMVRLRIPKILAALLSLTFGATFGSLPILLYHFGQFSVSSLLANILIASFLGWILFTGILYIGVSSLPAIIAKFYGILIYIPTKIVIEISKFFQNGWTILVPELYRGPVSIFLIGCIVSYYLFGEND